MNNIQIQSNYIKQYVEGDYTVTELYFALDYGNSRYITDPVKVYSANGIPEEIDRVDVEDHDEYFNIIFYVNGRAYKTPDISKVEGPQGPQGDEGESIKSIDFGKATIVRDDEITTTTYNEAYSTLTDETQIPIEPFSIISYNGAQGIQGPKGDKGNKGDQGPIGLKGDKGDIGPIGLTGPQGPVGPKGEQGIQGNEGPRGPSGSIKLNESTDITTSWYTIKGYTLTNVSDVDLTNDVVVHPGDSYTLTEGNYSFREGNQTILIVSGDDLLVLNEGAKGPQGDPGPQGPQGIMGDKGDNGSSVKSIEFGETETDVQTDYTLTIWKDPKSTLTDGTEVPIDPFYVKVKNGKDSDNTSSWYLLKLNDDNQSANYIKNGITYCTLKYDRTANFPEDSTHYIANDLNNVKDTTSGQYVDIPWKGVIGVTDSDNTSVTFNYMIEGYNFWVQDIGTNPITGNDTESYIKTINKQSLIGEGDIEIKDDITWKQSSLYPSYAGPNNTTLYMHFDRGDGTSVSLSGIQTKTVNGNSIIGNGPGDIAIPPADESWKKSSLERGTLINPLQYRLNRGDGTYTGYTQAVYFNTVNGNALVNNTKGVDIKIPGYVRQSPNHYYSEGAAFNLKYKDGTVILGFTRNQDWFAKCWIGSLDACVFDFGNDSAAFTATPELTSFNISHGGDRYNISLIANGFKANDLSNTLNVLVYVTYARKNGSINVMTTDTDFYFEKAI